MYKYEALAEVNAAFITRACNAHDALVKALERSLKGMLEISAMPNHGLGFGLAVSIREAEEALKLARGED